MPNLPNFLLARLLLLILTLVVLFVHLHWIVLPGLHDTMLLFILLRRLDQGRLDVQLGIID